MATPRPSSYERSPHLARDVAESFGAEAERYDRSRPHYPDELVDAVLAALPGHRVLDVGIGTGIAARPFRERGCEILGVEVDAAMAEAARQRGFEVEVSRFEDWDPAGRGFDGVIAGQTWHWIDPVAGATKAAEILRPEGRLALFWNVGDPSPDVADGFADVYRSVDPGLPFVPWTAPAIDGYDRIRATVADSIRNARAFDEPEHWRFDWDTAITRDAWLDQVPTQGGHSLLPTAILETILSGLASVIDESGGAFDMHYATVAVVARRR